MSVRVVGTRIDDVTRAQLIERLELVIRRSGRAYVCCANVHVVEMARRTPSLSQALEEADIVVADGAPVAWAASRHLGRKVQRITGSDVFEDLCQSRTARRHYFYGSTDTTLDAMERRFEAVFPQAVLVGKCAPPFRPLTNEELSRVAAEINASGAEVVWVGLGAPRQELWMRQMRPVLTAPVLVGVGAVFDFFALTRRRAPRFIQAVGLEWVHRLLQEPRRLGARYAVTNTRFLVAMLLKNERV